MRLNSIIHADEGIRLIVYDLFAQLLLHVKIVIMNDIMLDTYIMFFCNGVCCRIIFSQIINVIS